MALKNVVINERRKPQTLLNARLWEWASIFIVKRITAAGTRFTTDLCSVLILLNSNQEFSI